MREFEWPAIVARYRLQEVLACQLQSIETCRFDSKLSIAIKARQQIRSTATHADEYVVLVQPACRHVLDLSIVTFLVYPL
ncbi:hypothetical protein X979_4960 [Burkholderia pseudomallei MSHR7527]|nr:hypothetical protein DO63_2730 [Burkholderia pseudomallei]KGS68382.1 hypothetical protein X979_4960 [Burkholderia pseudomallei MSHR7527]